MIYLDNAATSFPKAPGVQEAMTAYFTEKGGNPGRGGHRMARAADLAMEQTRTLLKDLFHAPDSNHCIFTANATDSIHLALRGLLRTGDRVVVAPTIHNALSRPIRHMEKELDLSVHTLHVRDHCTDPAGLEEELKKGIRLLAINHLSNVTGHAEDLQTLGSLVKEYPETLFLVDAAQSAGHITVDMRETHIDCLILTGHKGLLGPAGCGALLLSEKAGEAIRPYRTGGSGIDSEDPFQPESLPWRLEAGTPPIPALLGLQAGLEYLKEQGIQALHQNTLSISSLLYKGLKEIPGMEIFTDTKQPFIISFRNHILSVSEWGGLLDEEFAIACRTGLHCAPGIHRYLGTSPHGLVRLSPSCFTTPDEIEQTLQAIRQVCGS